MNILKKILTVFLIVCMGVCMAAPAYAAEAQAEQSFDPTIITKITDAVDKYGEKVVKTAADLISKLADKLPGWMESVWKFLKAQIDNLVAALSAQKSENDFTSVIADKGSKAGDAIPKTYDNDGKLYWPVPYSGCYISNTFAGSSHKGIDICVTGGSEKKNIAAAQNAVVLATGTNVSAGDYVILDHGSGLFTLYYHCSAVLVKAGDIVSKGDIIARIGQTGNATGPHLHFEVRTRDSKGVQLVDPLSKVSLP